jgi:hypothetical protein
MIRPFTCLAFLLACGSGLYLYQSKHRVKLLDEQIAQTVKSTDALREQTRMLSAEWTLLNDPERLRQLASQFLTLQTVSPNQFTSLAELDSRLPAPVAPGTPGNGGTAPPSADAAIPMASNDAGRTGADEGRPGDARMADAKPAEARVADAAPSVSPKPAATQAAAPPPAAAPARVATAMPPDQVHPVESKPSEIARSFESKPAAPRYAIAMPPHPAAVQPRFPERSPGPVVAQSRPMAPPPRMPVSPSPQFAPRPTGSFLGMAHDMGAPPPPLPRPMPVSAPNWSYSSGG